MEDLLLADDRVDLDYIFPANDDPIIYSMIRSSPDTQRLTHLVQLSQRARFTFADPHGDLHMTAARADVESCMSFAQRYPWMTTLANDRGNTPLFCAVKNIHLEVCKCLRLRLEVTNCDERTVLLECTHRGDVSTCKFLLEEGGKDFLHAKNQEGRLPLIVTASSGNDEMVKFLIDDGADPNIGDHEGCTPLMLAIRHGQVTTVKLLLGAKGNQSPSARSPTMNSKHLDNVSRATRKAQP